MGAVGHLNRQLTVGIRLEEVEENHLVDGGLQLEVLARQVLGNRLQLLQLGKPAQIRFTSSLGSEYALKDSDPSPCRGMINNSNILGILKTYKLVILNRYPYLPYLFVGFI